MRIPLRSGRALEFSRVLAMAFLLAGCDRDIPTDGSNGLALTELCSIPQDEIFSGALKDAIPALTDPPMAAANSPEASLWEDTDRVMGLVLDGDPIAVPLNILWWHEIVNLDHRSRQLVVTHCPLTGSSLAFDRHGLGIEEFGVSGLLFQNNLIMYDRPGEDDGDNSVGESLWPQMSRGSRCGSRNGTDLVSVPILEVTWGGWKELYPNTIVVTPDTGFRRGYDALGYPYGGYRIEHNPRILFPLPEPVDPRRPPKERVLGVPAGTGGAAFPFGSLSDLGPAAAIPGTAGGEDFVVFWDEGKRAAMAYRPVLDGQPMTFVVTGDRIEDVETGSEWDVSGTAVSGVMVGHRLEPIPEAFVAFWFAWLPFYPDMELWTP